MRIRQPLFYVAATAIPLCLVIGYQQLKLIDFALHSSGISRTSVFFRSVVQATCPSEKILQDAAAEVGMSLVNLSSGFPVPVGFQSDPSFALELTPMEDIDALGKSDLLFYFGEDGCLIQRMR